jgi:hypothetical protein
MLPLPDALAPYSGYPPGHRTPWSVILLDSEAPEVAAKYSTNSYPRRESLDGRVSMGETVTPRSNSNRG